MKYISIPEEQYERDKQLIEASKKAINWGLDKCVVLSYDTDDGAIPWELGHYFIVVSRDVAIDDLNKQLKEARDSWGEVYNKNRELKGRIELMKTNHNILVGVLIFIIFVLICVSLYFVYN